MIFTASSPDAARKVPFFFAAFFPALIFLSAAICSPRMRFFAGEIV
jgi:hypothetical protein